MPFYRVIVEAELRSTADADVHQRVGCEAVRVVRAKGLRLAEQKAMVDVDRALQPHLKQQSLRRTRLTVVNTTPVSIWQRLRFLPMQGRLRWRDPDQLRRAQPLTRAAAEL